MSAASRGPLRADIELVDVRKMYGPVTAVDGVSLEVAAGEFFSLLGPSGCGKTTLLRMIAGFVLPTSGEIRIRGKVVNDVPAYKRETNMVFQQLALFPHLNVFDNIAFGPKIKGVSRSEIRTRVARVLEQVGLAGYDKRWSHELSGGQQQRVAIARAVINEPTALLLDEPLGSLDLKLRNQMQLELKAMQKRLGTTFIYVTHDQGEAMLMSDRIAVMNNGRVEQVGGPQEIYARPRTRFVAHFIGETNLLSGFVKASSGETTEIDANGLRLKARGPAVGGDRVTLSIRPESIQIGAGPLQHENQFSALVETAIFLGSLVRYELRLNDTCVLIAQAQAQGSLPYPAGEHVQVGWAASQTVVLAEDPR